MRCLRSIAVLLLVVAALEAPSAAATILLKNGDALRGRVVDRAPGEIIIELTAEDGTKSRQTLSAAEVDQVLPSVSATRLAGLRPENPKGYQLYAEELAEKRIDPEARETAIRLYLIAAHLDPDTLGRSCLLGMAGLAHDDDEARRFRAMAYLLDPNHDRRLLSPGSARAPSAVAAAVKPDAALQLVRMIRGGKRREVERLLEAEGGDAKLAELEQLMPPQEVRQLVSRTCIHCETGYLECPMCQGSGRLRTGRPCPQCRIGSRALGKIRCEHCGGRYREPSLTPAQLRLLIEAELKLLGQHRDPTPKLSDTAGVWSAGQADAPPVRTLSLESVTEHDPRECVYREGRWTTP